VTHAFTAQVIASLAFVKQIAGRTVLIRLLRVCGTLKRCKEAALDFSERLFVSVNNPSESQLRRHAEELKRIQQMRD
jgi:hypothetical protein